MLNDYFKHVELSLDWETFLALPRHPAYRFEYQNQVARISPNPRFAHCLLTLQGDDAPILPEPASGAVSCFFAEFEQRPLGDDDWEALSGLFATAFRRSAPLSQWTKDQQAEAARALMQRTRSGADGPLVPQSCLTLADRMTGELRGAILITLVPAGNLSDFTDPQWRSNPPEDAVTSGWGQPHLTWIFVDPHFQKRGLATALLREASSRLRQRGDSHLASTFLIGDHASMLWHWRMGFRLVSSPGHLKRSSKP